MTSANSIPRHSDEAQWHERIRRRELRRYASFVSILAEQVEFGEVFTTETPCKLARLIGETARLLAERIPEAPPDSLVLVNQILNWMAAHLRYVERACVEQTPWSIIQSAEDFFRRQTGPESNFIIRPTWSYNYSLVGEFCDFYKRLLGTLAWFPLNELKKKVPFMEKETIYCISFPLIERQNCLLHANWGHEVGHIIAAKWSESEFENMWSQAQPEITNSIEKHVRGDPPSADPLFKKIIIKKMVAHHTTTAMETARRGLTELICDIIGVHLFGLSALAAATEFAARSALDISPLTCGYYPPWRYRMRLMFEYCDEDLKNYEGVGYPGKVIKPFVEWLQQGRKITEIKSDVKVINSDVATRQAYKFISSNWQAIRTEAISLVSSDSSEPYRLHERCRIIEHLINKLESGIPPNEAGSLSEKPASLQDILSAAWVFKMYNVAKDDSWGELEDFNLLYRLVLKACESSYVHSLWKTLCEDEGL